MVKKGVCDEECLDCKWLWASGTKQSLWVMCDYYIETGNHRLIDENGRCVGHTPAPRKKRYKIDFNKRKSTIRWDVEKAEKLYVAGIPLEVIASEMCIGYQTLKNYSNSHWKHLNAERQKHKIERMRREREAKKSGGSNNVPVNESQTA